MSMLTAEEEREIAEWKLKNPSPPSTPTPPKFAENKHILDDMETELKLKRLEFDKAKLDAEILKFNAPSTNIDYYSKMLELQNQAHSNSMLMMNKQFELQLEIEKLKLGGDSDDYALVLLDMLRPYAGDIMKQVTGTPYPNMQQNINNQTAPKKEGENTLKASASTPSSTEMKTDINLDEYKAKIKKGEVTIEQAWKDFKAELPAYVPMFENSDGTFNERFKVEYEKIKNGV